jgi:hypothetical protein
MRRALLTCFGIACFLALLLICYRAVLFGDEQLAGGNYSYFDYPLYLRVQQEWNAGRWPLWEPGQNGGMPLLGNPIAAVLYPGKLLYALLPYPWAARLYVIAHTVVAFFGLLAFGRSCGLSWAGSCLGGLSYAFGAPVLFQYCNAIYLVGAAWIPWGLRAIDRLLRQGWRRGGVELATILALQVLGGDPQAAYLTAVCGAGYAVVLGVQFPSGLRRLLFWPMILGAVCIWVVATLSLASTRIARPGLLPIKGLVLAAWLVVGIVAAWRWLRRPDEARFATLLFRLAGGCTLALAVSAAQILPVLEFVGTSWRAAGITATNRYRYSVHPCRVAEIIWPNVFGSSAAENRSWLQAVPPAGEHEVWVGSLYMGGLALVLALSAAGWRHGPPWRAWLTAVALVALAASLGKYGSSTWWARSGPLAAVETKNSLAGAASTDHFLDDEAVSPYGLLAAILPGFDSFRYPSKLLPFMAVGLAVLVGAGWDRLAAGDTKVPRRLAQFGLGASLVGLLLACAARGRIVAYLTGRIPPDSMLGPADIDGAWAETQRALVHGGIVFGAVIALARWAPRRPRGAWVVAMLLMIADLALANARLIWTVPQAEFDTPSEAARLIATAEQNDPSPGPFRIHRMPGWFPVHCLTTRSPQRFQELIGWARTTLNPLIALPLGLQYCTTIGSLEVEDYIAFFTPRAMPVASGTARAMGVPPGQPLVYFPRRSFDIWGARYFILPASPDWASRERGFAAFLDKTELIHPSPNVLRERQSAEGGEPWGVRHDWQLRRNRAAYPRAWVVHDAQVRPPSADVDTRARRMRTLIYMNDPIWSEPNRPVFNLREAALIETDDPGSLQGFVSKTPVDPSESVAVGRYEPQRVELKAFLVRPGLVILADTFYPGWRLTIDGKTAPIFRANRVMRGAALQAGEHRLVYTYEPESFRVGVIISAGALIVLLALAGSSWRKPPAQ